MGAKQSKRSVDITTTPKKGDGEVVIGEGEGKVEKIAELDVKTTTTTTNGTIHPEIEYADKEEQQSDKGDIKENGVSESEDGGKTPEDGDVTTPAAGDQINESIQETKTTTSPTTENNDENKDKSPTVEETTENKKNKEKSKKKKWSLRSISFSKKDKSKPSKDSEKNGDVKEINEENAAETSPSVETPKTEEPKVPVAAVAVDDATVATPITATNGDATADELAKVDETSTTEELAVVKEEPAKVPEPAESAPSPVKEEPSKVVEEPTPQVEESKPVVEITNTITPDNVVEECKEVRTEDVPPPLPSSNPPSPVTVFAESTKADNNLNEIVPPVDNQIEQPVEQCEVVVANITDETPKIIDTVSETSNIESIPNEEQISKTENEPVESIASTEATIGSIDNESLPPPPQESESVELSEPVSVVPLPDIVNDNATKETDSSPDKTESNASVAETIPDKEIVAEKIAATESTENISSVNSETDKQSTIVEEPVENSKSEECPIQKPLPVENTVEAEQSSTEKDPVPQSPVETDVSKQDIPASLSEPVDSSTADVNVIKDQPASVTETVSSELPVQNVDSCIKAESITELPNENISFPIQDAPPVDTVPKHVECTESNEIVSSLPIQEKTPSADVNTLVDNPESNETISSPMQDDVPSVDIPTSTENPEPTSVNNADSLPDISTESLPSLPEPVSESLPEPMSLPPVESCPEPITSDSTAIVPDPPTNSSSIVDTLQSPASPLQTNETVLTNGNMNGLPSPVVVTNDEIVPSVEGPLKQIPTAIPECHSETTAPVEATQESTATTEE